MKKILVLSAFACLMSFAVNAQTSAQSDKATKPPVAQDKLTDDQPAVISTPGTVSSKPASRGSCCSKGHGTAAASSCSDKKSASKAECKDGKSAGKSSCCIKEKTEAKSDNTKSEK